MQANSGAEAPITAINITPLVDVALVLVIIFMVTLPYVMEKAMKVNASDQKAVAASSIKDPILVEVSARGVQVEGKTVAERELPGVLKRLLKERGLTAVAVSAERGVSHGRVVSVLDEAMDSGAQELNLLDPKEGAHGA